MVRSGTIPSSLPTEFAKHADRFVLHLGRRLVALAVRVLLAVTLAASSRALQAQMPTADQIRRLLETQPSLLLQLQQEVAASGFTLDQIHARLQAAGYPANLL